MSKSRDNEKRFNFLRRTAKEVMRYRITKKILLTAMILLATLLSVVYVVSALYKKSGSFTVSVDKYEMTEYGLTLSERSDMEKKSSSLNAAISKDITNIAEESIPKNVDQTDGKHNGEDYIAYTFYLQNAGKYDVSYEYTVNMSNITNALDEAIRLRLYVNGSYQTYAKTKSDGSGPEEGTVAFASSTEMARGRIDAFKPNDKTKFTVVIWIEGSDPDCVDWLIGGQMKIDMTMSIVH